MLAPDGRWTVGRREELDAIDELVDGLRSGAPAVLVLRGEAGIGKSHLCRVALSQATAAGFRTAVATADELEQDRPGRVLFEAEASLRSDHLDVLAPSEDHPSTGIRATEQRSGITWAQADWDGTLAEIDAAFALREDTGVVIHTILFRSLAALIALERGRPDEAATHVEAAEDFVAGVIEPPRVLWRRLGLVDTGCQSRLCA